LRSLLIYYGLPWRRLALKHFYRSLLPIDALVFDVGAHVGSRSHTIVSIGGRCIAIEPQPLFARWLAWLFRHNPRVELVVAAVGAHPGQASLRISSRHPTVSTLSSDWIGQVKHAAGFERVAWDTRVDVPVTTVDLLIERYGQPDFLKIDVEGFEAEILAGCSKSIALVAVEYLPAALNVLWQCIDRLEALGEVEYNFVTGETHRFVLEQWVPAEQIRGLIEQAASSGRSGDLYARQLRLDPPIKSVEAVERR
jgi:FkbM family methyltransferase